MSDGGQLSHNRITRMAGISPPKSFLIAPQAPFEGLPVIALQFAGSVTAWLAY
jgi:hypothetical protein